MTAPQQEWAGAFGDDYTMRQQATWVQRRAANTALFAKALARVSPPQRLVEFGAGAGDNIAALHTLYPDMQAHAVEVNPTAAGLITGARVHITDAVHGELPLECHGDLVLTKGFLIHVPPEQLPAMYDRMLSSTTRLILIAEYYNPTPCAVRYRDREGLLWKRDFARELVDTADKLVGPGRLRMIDYGFVWRHDPQPQDDLTWFLLAWGPR